MGLSKEDAEGRESYVWYGSDEEYAHRKVYAEKCEFYSGVKVEMIRKGTQA